MINNSCTEVLANQPCTFDVQLPQGLAPGSYSLEVLVPGKGGGQSARTVNIDVRASAWLAGIVIALGVALGGAVTDWRTTARPIVNRRIIVARLREDVERLAETATQVPVARRVRQLVLELKALDAEILAGETETAKLAMYRERFELLTRAEALLQAAAQPKEGRPRSSACWPLAVSAWSLDPAQAEFGHVYRFGDGRKVDAACIFPVVIPRTSIVRIAINYTRSDRINIVRGMDKVFGVAPAPGAQ